VMASCLDLSIVGAVITMTVNMIIYNCENTNTEITLYFCHS
jgi:hypothetical protein